MDIYRQLFVVGRFRKRWFRRQLVAIQSVHHELTWEEHDTGWLETTFIVRAYLATMEIFDEIKLQDTTE